jgi:hypothetical protein
MDRPRAFNTLKFVSSRQESDSINIGHISLEELLLEAVGPHFKTLIIDANCISSKKLISLQNQKLLCTAKIYIITTASMPCHTIIQVSYKQPAVCRNSMP